ncbi:MAG: phycobilisome rod-core linker polypeptide [Thermosynechococcaceae cyanobacterium]
MAISMATQSTKLQPVPAEEEYDDLQVVIRSIYRQVLGNVHVMESQRLSIAESRVQSGEFTVREFVRAIALSDLYRSLFFETSSAYRFIELNFKHFLGRAPQDQAEIAEHVGIYNTQGYEAEINSYIDSDEYTSNFGEYDVPSARGAQTQTGIKNVVFGRTSALIQGYAANDISNQAKLIRDVAGNLPTKVKSSTPGVGAVISTSKRFRIAVTKASFGRQVTRSNAAFEVDYNQLSQKIQYIQKAGSKILSITEIS